MDFFEQQDRARKQTGRLVLLFVVALTALIVLTAFIFAGMIYIFNLHGARFESYETGQSLWQIAATVFDWQYIGSIAIAVLAVVGLASLFRLSQLRGGGRAIAEQLGGRYINTHPRNKAEQQLLNIVEEMAIASGVPVPGVYLIDEPGINAFAAGYESADAVVGVTQGALTQLTRHELQGVIAHEFSHILNGDMRINLRLIGMIYGITVIALSGRYLLHGGRHSRRNNRGAALSIGLVLILLGYLGVFFGNVIKAAISRQREFLADASAVQFTRSNQGIADALKKIGGFSYGSMLQNPNADEVSHMLFGQGLQFHFFQKLMATHPPLKTRIKRIDPRWNGQFLMPSTPPPMPSDASTTAEESAPAAGVAALVANSDLSTAIDHSGAVTDNHIAAATTQLTQLHSEFARLSRLVHEPYAARALVYALLLDECEAVRQAQWQEVQQNQSAVLLKQMQLIADQLPELNAVQPMMLLDIALPVLKLLTDDQYASFKNQMLRLIKIDKKIEIREWALFYLINYFCRSEYDWLAQKSTIASRKPAVAQLLSALSHIGADSSDGAHSVFSSCVAEQFDFKLRWYKPEELTIQTLTQALQQIRNIKPLEKPRFLKACAAIVEYDNQVQARELEVITCIAQALNCPLPYLQMQAAARLS